MRCKRRILSRRVCMKKAEAARHMVKEHPEKEPIADAIFVVRQFIREPEWVLRVAWKLGSRCSMA